MPAKRMPAIHKAGTAHAVLVHAVIYHGMEGGVPSYEPKTLCGRKVVHLIRRKYEAGGATNCLRCDTSYLRKLREAGG